MEVHEGENLSSPECRIGGGSGEKELKSEHFSGMPTLSGWRQPSPQLKRMPIVYQKVLTSRMGDGVPREDVENVAHT